MGEPEVTGQRQALVVNVGKAAPDRAQEIHDRLAEKLPGVLIVILGGAEQIAVVNIFTEDDDP